MLRREKAHFTVSIGVHRAAAAHGDDDGRDVCALKPGGEVGTQLVRGDVGIVRHKEDARLGLVAYEAVHALEKIPPLGCDAHVGHDAVHRLAVFLRKVEGALDDILADIGLDDHAVRVFENLVALLVENIADAAQVGALGDGACQIAALVENRQPHAHPVRDGADIVGVDLVPAELAHDLFALGGFVHKTHKDGAQLHIRNVLRHVAAHAAVDKFDLSGVAPGGQIQILREALNVHKYRADNHDRHKIPSCGSKILLHM